MNDLLFFSFVTFLCVLPIIILLTRIILKKSITFYITSVFIIALIIVGNGAFIIGKLGFSHILTVAPVGFLTMLGLILFLLIKIKKPLSVINNNLEQLSKGNILKKQENKKSILEYQSINVFIEQLNSNLKSYLKFASNITENKLDKNFSLTSTTDVLGKALVKMRTNLIVSLDDEQKRKEIEYVRNWKNNGINKIVETLRHNNKNLFDLSFEVLSNFVSYIDANVGGIFMLEDNDGDQYLELVASYAYDRRKFLKKRVELKEGLIGACALEQKTIYLSKVPSDYMNITTGLGEGEPRSILIVPLQMDEKLIGILELAAFKEFKKHEIEFTEAVSENIASMLLNLKRQKETNFLLAKRKEQKEEMAQQEEQMNLIYDELQSSQEEIEQLEDDLETKNNEIRSLKEELKSN